MDNDTVDEPDPVGSAVKPQRARVVPAHERVPLYWKQTAGYMAASSLIALVGVYLSSWFTVGPPGTVNLRDGLQRTFAKLVGSGLSFGLGALGVICALLLPLYLGVSGRGTLHGRVASDEFQNALAVQDVREDLILFLCLGGAVTGWLLLPAAISTIVFVIPILMLIGALCCLICLREETAAQGILRDMRAQKAERGLRDLVHHLGIDPNDPQRPDRRARTWAQVREGLMILLFAGSTFAVLWWPFISVDRLAGLRLAMVLTLFFLHSWRTGVENGGRIEFNAPDEEGRTLPRCFSGKVKEVKGSRPGRSLL